MGVVKQQVVVIHGGTSFDTHEEYIEFLKTRDISLEKLVQGGEDWRFSLADELGDAFEVLLPKMPNGTNVRYAEWCIWLERCLPFFQDDVILVGHSLGGIFLAKYLSEKSFPKTIKATVLVAAPFDSVSTVESLTDFTLPASLEQLAAQGGGIYIIQGKDDPVVSSEEAEKYQRALPQAKKMMFNDKQHFNQKSFPELVALLRSISMNV